MTRLKPCLYTCPKCFQSVELEYEIVPLPQPIIMTIEQYDKLRADLAAFRESIVQAKRPEYTEGNVDVLHNFKVVAAELNITPLQVWYVYFRKHIASISQFCQNDGRQMSEPIRGRIADAMNYLELLDALTHELTKE